MLNERLFSEETMKKLFRLTLLSGMILALSACSTWDGMSSREKKMVGGAAVGAATGAWIFDGAVLGTVGGAAVGGLVGDQLGK